MFKLDDIYGKITKLVDGDDVVWEVGKDNVKEIEIGKVEDGTYNLGYVHITMRDDTYKEVYGFIKSIKVEFE
jgi:hypothetical protein